MKYKVGDRVKIKTWAKLEQEYGLGYDGSISPPSGGHFFSKVMENIINEAFTDRILTIDKKIDEFHYYMKGIEDIWAWCDYMIEERVKEKCITFDSIKNRFELMDFD